MFSLNDINISSDTRLSILMLEITKNITTNIKESILLFAGRLVSNSEIGYSTNIEDDTKNFVGMLPDNPSHPYVKHNVLAHWLGRICLPCKMS